MMEVTQEGDPDGRLFFEARKRKSHDYLLHAVLHSKPDGALCEREGFFHLKFEPTQGRETQEEVYDGGSGVFVLGDLFWPTKSIVQNVYMLDVSGCWMLDGSRQHIRYTCQ